MMLNKDRMPGRATKLQIIGLAAKYGWALEQEQPAQGGLLIFTKTEPGIIPDGMQINVYTTTMTVATILTHPKRGRGQMFRRGCTFGALGLIFKNPRAHLGTGYHPRRPRLAPGLGYDWLMGAP